MSTRSCLIDSASCDSCVTNASVARSNQRPDAVRQRLERGAPWCRGARFARRAPDSEGRAALRRTREFRIPASLHKVFARFSEVRQASGTGSGYNERFVVMSNFWGARIGVAHPDGLASSVNRVIPTCTRKRSRVSLEGSDVFLPLLPHGEASRMMCD